MKTEITEQTMFKWLLPDRFTTYKKVKWPVPARQWTPPVPDPRLCSRGWHLATFPELGQFAKVNTELWVAVGRGSYTTGDSSKVAYESVKLVECVGVVDKKLLVTWAADCAGRVLSIYENRYPGDDRVRKAIDAARGWVKSGSISAAAAAAADDDDAAAAAAAAAADAAAAAAADDDDAAAAAAYAAAYAATYAAAAYARTAERTWQSFRLIELILANGEY